MVASVIDRAGEEVRRHYDAARQLSLSLLYWLQTERPRPDGGCGYPGLYPRPDVSGAAGGLAKAPYIRESRRIRALRTVTEAHVGTVMRGGWDPARPPEDPGQRGGAATGGDLRGLRRDRLLPVVRHAPLPFHRRVQDMAVAVPSVLVHIQTGLERAPVRRAQRMAEMQARYSAPDAARLSKLGLNTWSLP